MHTLVISPDCAKKGYGRSFIEFYERYAIENNCPELRIDTNALNIVARQMYKKYGYTEIGIKGINLVLLEKYLG